MWSSATAYIWASSAYGNGWIETPHLDRLAAEGVVFDHHFPENLTTLPTRRSWWTGRYGFPDPEQGWTPLQPDEAILPDLLWNQGVRTALISDVLCSATSVKDTAEGSMRSAGSEGKGTTRSFPPATRGRGRSGSARSRGCGSPKDDPDYALWKGRWEQLLRNRAVLQTDREENTGVARTVRSAIDWLETQGAKPDPFLLWLDLFSPHGPWDTPEPYRDQYAAAEAR